MIARPIIRAHKTVLDGFKRRAWRAYPNEYIERIIGLVLPDGFDIHILAPVDHTASKLYVNYDHDPEDISDTEEATNLKFLGYIHTHCGLNVCKHFSEQDYLDAIKNHELLSAVCWLYKNNGRKHSEFHFEISQPPTLLEISNH